MPSFMSTIRRSKCLRPSRNRSRNRRCARTRIPHERAVSAAIALVRVRCVRGAMCYIALLLMMRLAGKRAFGEMSPFDIVVLMLVGGALRSRARWSRYISSRALHSRCHDPLRGCRYAHLNARHTMAKRAGRGARGAHHDERTFVVPSN
jgi:hypothetical protein